MSKGLGRFEDGGGTLRNSSSGRGTGRHDVRRGGRGYTSAGRVRNRKMPIRRRRIRDRNPAEDITRDVGSGSRGPVRDL